MSQDAILAAGYARVSTDNQLENYSIQEQAERLRAYCEAKGWTLVKTYTDGGYSGGNTNRPALRQMLESLRRGEVNVVLVCKLDRLSRSQKDTLTLIEDDILACGADFVSINENFDTSTPFGRAMIGILSVFAQLEKDQITERFTMGRIGRGKAGYFHGGGNAPTGYDYREGLLQVKPYEAMQVREVFDLFLSGKSINAICRALRQRYTTNWTPAKVRNVLKNSLYIGKVKFLGNEYPGRHEPLIAPAVFDEAQRLLQSLSRERTESGAQRRPFRAGYLLSGLLYCGRCGARYTANHGYYKCYSRAKSTPKYIVDPDCRNDNWRIEELDALVLGHVRALCLVPGAADALLAGADRAQEALDPDSLRRRVKAIDTQLGKLVDLYQLSAIPAELLRSRADALSAEKAALLARLEAPGETVRDEGVQAATQDFLAGLDASDTDCRRALLAALIQRIDLNGRSLAVSWRV